MIERIKLDPDVPVVAKPPPRIEPERRRAKLEDVDDRLDRRGGASNKSRGIYMILGLVTGVLGFHNLYAGRYGVGIFQLIGLVATAAGCAIAMKSILDGVLTALAACFVLVLLELLLVKHDGLGRPFDL
jgi:hypothetical protein